MENTLILCKVNFFASVLAIHIVDLSTTFPSAGHSRSRFTQGLAGKQNVHGSSFDAVNNSFIADPSSFSFQLFFCVNENCAILYYDQGRGLETISVSFVLQFWPQVLPLICV